MLEWRIALNVAPNTRLTHVFAETVAQQINLSFPSHRFQFKSLHMIHTLGIGYVSMM